MLSLPQGKDKSSKGNKGIGKSKSSGYEARKHGRFCPKDKGEPT